MTERWDRLQQIFLEAAELAPERRAAYLRETCGDDAALRARIERMLAHDDDTAALLALPLAAGSDPPGTARAGERIGAYEIERQLGYGGMGDVYLASRADEHYRKRVAIKVLRQDRANPELSRRFRAERHILAALVHPHIASLVDAGATPEGLPYLVMEYVDGQPIVAYCNERRLSVGQRLELFLKVCDAVQHAHRNLVVHRDIKPSNILVTPEGQPKLLDFGIAKLLEASPLACEAPETRTGLRLLTPEYASPEQLRGDPISTAADVYSLGVLLYELLTGTSPYVFVGRSAVEIERVVCETDPPRPSSVISHQTGASARELRSKLSGDLDNIVLIALRKNPSERYVSVDRLAADIRCHLQGLPVSATAPTWSYRSRKFIRRHRFGTATSAIFVILVAGFAALNQVHARRAANERDTAREVTTFLLDVFKVSDPNEARGSHLTAREVLDRGARRVRFDLRARPALQATMMSSIGSVYENLGMLERAEELYGEALALRRRLGRTDDPEIAESLNLLGGVLLSRNDFEKAESLVLEALAMRRRLLGPEHPALVHSLLSVASLRRRQGRFEEAVGANREALAMARAVHEPRSEMIVDCLNQLGTSLTSWGLNEEAERTLREALALQVERNGGFDPLVADIKNNLGIALDNLKRFDEAEVVLRETVDLQRSIMGDGSEDVALALNNLAAMLKSKGKPREAEAPQREALAIFRGLYGEEHQYVALSLNNLANIKTDEGLYDEAATLHRQALATNRKLFGDESAAVATSLSNLGAVLIELGDYAGALPLYLETLELDRKTLNEDHPFVAMDLHALGSALAKLGRYEEAEARIEEALELNRRAGREEDSSSAQFASSLGQIYLDTGRLDPAERVLRRAIELIEAAQLPEGRTELHEARRLLGECLAQIGRSAEAEALLLEAYRALASHRSNKSATDRALRSLVGFYEKQRSTVRASEFRTLLASSANHVESSR